MSEPGSPDSLRFAPGCRPVTSGLLAFSGGFGGASVEGAPGPRGGVGSEELLPRSEMLAGEGGVVRAGMRTPGGQALDFAAAFGPVIVVRDGRRRR